LVGSVAATELVGGIKKSRIWLRGRRAALVRGDIDTYLALIEHANDYTLMAPFGGSPTRGFDASPAHRAAMARFFKSGTLQQEVVATYDSGDLIVLVTIERVRATVGELPEQGWSLRVTQVFRHEGSKWKLVHRHADPLVNGITLNQAAFLARSEKQWAHANTELRLILRLVG
jgi:ketosteroid isomerase-like protein